MKSPPVGTASDPPRPSADADERSEILFRIFEFAPDAILVVDRGGRIIKANAQAERMFGHPRGELLGEAVELLVPRRLAEPHVAYREGYVAAPHTRPMGMGLELLGRRKDGSEFPVDVMLSPLGVGDEPPVLAVVRDATERRRVEAQAREAREMYIKEVHHRVKNNLQVISSLLFLQSTHTSDPRVLPILQESQARVKSIALIHEKLYRSPDLARVDFAEYVRDLVADLFRTYGVHHDLLSVHTELDDVSLDIDTAVPCGLLINELVSNVLKHAFPPGTAGSVWIGLSRAGPRAYHLSVRDDGVGLPPGLDWRTARSLGLRLVMDLARQLDGSVEVESGAGTAFRIAFREVQYRDRS